MSIFVQPSLVRGPHVVRGFKGQNISSQKPRTREVLLYSFIAKIGLCSPEDEKFSGDCRALIIMSDRRPCVYITYYKRMPTGRLKLRG